MRDTVEILRCDGYDNHACGRVMTGPESGLIIRGTVSTPGQGAGAPRVVLGGREKDQPECATCWDCIEKATGRPARVVTKIEYRTETKYESDYHDSGRGSGSGGGATGPLPPPELPRHVLFTRSLALVGLMQRRSRTPR